MAQHDVIHQQQAAAGAAFISYGGEGGVEVVETFGEYEAEYAAIRKGVGLMATPQRGLIAVRGTQWAAFLQSMLTNDTSDKELPPGRSCRAFLLNRAGRIDADMVVARLDADDPAGAWMVVDQCDAEHVVKQLDQYVFAEDVEFEDVSAQYSQISLHGPEAGALVGKLSGSSSTIEVDACVQIEMAGHSGFVYRRDEAGLCGLHLIMPADDTAVVHEQMAEAIGGLMPDVEGGSRRQFAGRGIGWLAYNTARIEAGTPLFHVDFGPDSLPHESGVLREAVSFTKGCYLGQEIVARMENLGHPKKLLVGLKMADERLPIAGTQVFDEDEATVIGAVTSSTASPMLGQKAIGFAMVKWGRHRPGTNVKVAAEGQMVEALTHGLGFLDG